jgi:antitoxin component of RelBE/YafQ-DinJ toxin-antitoxin module
MNISFKYDDAVWERFKAVAKDKYGMDATQAMKRLIDYVVRNEAIPDLMPLLAIVSGDYKTTEVTPNAKVSDRNTGRPERLDKTSR